MPHRILIVDTHPLNRLVVSEQLATLGYATIAADDGDEALALLDVGHFDLVIVECRMPGMDGFALAARIRAFAMARGIDACPVIGYAIDPALDAPLATQCGMRACLPMPMPLAVLEQALRKVLPAQAATPRGIGIAQWDLFVATSREDLRQARDCLRDGRTVQLRDILHRIKGAALMLGESDLAASCARAESGCEEWGASALAGAIDLVQAHLDAACARACDDAQWEPSR
jgi:two-component system sensor histidine kinase EvgS